jgi:peroxiredoxin
VTTIDLAPAPRAPATLPIGAAGPAFDDLRSVDGNSYASADFADRDVLVLIFSSNRCPTAKAYGERMDALQREFGGRRVQLVALNANDPHLYPDESYPRMIERAAEDGYSFPYLVDDGQRLARAYGAACTFHVFVLDRDRRLRYEGRFDDSRIPERVTSHDLANALEDVLAGREVRVPTTRPFGCSLDFV